MNKQQIVNPWSLSQATPDALTTDANRAIDLLKERRSAPVSAAVAGTIDVRGAVELAPQVIPA